MGLPNGVHHLALNTGDMKAQIEFFTDVLGAELKALYWMHGTNGYFHGFLKLNDLATLPSSRRRKAPLPRVRRRRCRTRPRSITSRSAWRTSEISWRCATVSATAASW